MTRQDKIEAQAQRLIDLADWDLLGLNEQESAELEALRAALALPKDDSASGFALKWYASPRVTLPVMVSTSKERAFEEQHPGTYEVVRVRVTVDPEEK